MEVAGRGGGAPGDFVLVNFKSINSLSSASYRASYNSWSSKYESDV